MDVCASCQVYHTACMCTVALHEMLRGEEIAGWQLGKLRSAQQRAAQKPRKSGGGGGMGGLCYHP